MMNNAAAFFASLRASLEHGLAFRFWQVAFPWAHINKPSRWRRYCRDNIYAPRQPLVQCGPPYTKGATRSGIAFIRDTINLNRAKASFVFRTLLETRRPSAIIRAITKVGVQTVNRVVARRPYPHVGKKILEGFIPSFANKDSSRAIFGEVFAFRVATSALHPYPYPVGWAWAGARFVAMFKHVACIYIHKGYDK